MCLTEPGWVLEPGLCLRWGCWEMPQEQRYNQETGISDFRKSWWFGRSSCELSLSDLIFSALDPLYFLKARLCTGVLSQLREITKQETLPGRKETHGLSIQTPVCHTDSIAYSNFPQGRGKTTLLVLPAHSSSPWTASFQLLCQSRELPTQMCNPSSSFSLFSPLSMNPPGTCCTPGFQTCRSTAQHFCCQFPNAVLSARQKLLMVAFLQYFILIKLSKMRNRGWGWSAFMRWRDLDHLERPNGQFYALLCHAANSQQNFATVFEMKEDFIKLCDNYVWASCLIGLSPP